MEILKAKTHHFDIEELACKILGLDYDEIDAGYIMLARELGAVYPGSGSRREAAEAAVAAAKKAVGGMPVAIDYTIVSRPVQLAKFLTQHGFRVTDIYLDAVPAAFVAQRVVRAVSLDGDGNLLESAEFRRRGIERRNLPPP